MRWAQWYEGDRTWNRFDPAVAAALRGGSAGAFFLQWGEFTREGAPGPPPRVAVAADACVDAHGGLMTDAAHFALRGCGGAFVNAGYRRYFAHDEVVVIGQFGCALSLHAPRRSGLTTRVPQDR